MSAALDKAQSLLEELVAPICVAHGVELVDIRFVRMKGGGVVRVIIDRERPVDPNAPAESGPDGSGISLADCTAVSRDLSTALDVHDEVFPGKFHLEVSSPGLERPLVKPQDFVRFSGREVKVHTRVPVANQRNFHGNLLGVEGADVKLKEGDVEKVIPIEAISKAHLVYRF
ncbi:MAG: ribosome maturation factor RimP [Myxococcales bacterium]|nr:ribosome maturation factor RimP [Myxococcales bacterium]